MHSDKAPSSSDHVRSKLQKTVDRLRNELAEAEVELGREEGVTDAQRLAKILHDDHCPRHLGGCDWEFDGENWSKRGHVRYLEKAESLLQISDMDTLLRVTDVLRKLPH